MSVPSLFRPVWALTGKEIVLQPWNFKNGAHNFNSVLSLFEHSEWQPLLHQNQGVRLSCFTAREMLAYPLAYIISPAVCWWGVGATRGRRREGDGRQVVKFPLAGTSLPPSGWLFHELRFSSRSGPRGHPKSCQLRQQLLSHECLLTDREATGTSKKPGLLPSNRLQLTQKRTKNTELTEVLGKMTWKLKGVES